MKQYELRSLRELFEQWDRLKQPEDVPKKIVEFFASGDQGRQLGEGGEQKSTGVKERGPAAEVSGNGPTTKERGNGENLAVHG